MIRTLRGILEALGPDWAVVSVGGRGLPGFRTLLGARWPGTTEQPREPPHPSGRTRGIADPYGFPTEDGLHVFELLLGISGVGPRLALSVLSGISPQSLAVAIAAEDENALAAISGVGKRTAARIIVDLKGKLEEQWPIAATAGAGTDRGDVFAALVALGYTLSDARRAVVTLPQDPSLSVEDQVREALRALSPG